ncbi:hypothetical protein BHM03_00030724 [Ensete ventricosum]|nr:hypothetical protein BHM03_00030724 [Ensete ventricosum]
MIGAMELQPDDGPISSFSIGSGFGQCSGISPEFARRFVEGIGKLTGNISEDHRKKTRRLTARIPEATRLAGRFGQSQVYASGRSLDDAVRNSPGVRRELIHGIESLPGWRKRVRWKKIETRQKIIRAVLSFVGEVEAIGSRDGRGIAAIGKGNDAICDGGHSRGEGAGSKGTSVAGRGGLIAVAEVAMFLLYCERKTLATPKGHKRLRVATETGLRQWQSRQRLQSGVEFGTR